MIQFRIHSPVARNLSCPSHSTTKEQGWYSWDSKNRLQTWPSKIRCNPIHFSFPFLRAPANSYPICLAFLLYITIYPSSLPSLPSFISPLSRPRLLRSQWVTLHLSHNATSTGPITSQAAIQEQLPPDTCLIRHSTARHYLLRYPTPATLGGSPNANSQLSPSLPQSQTLTGLYLYPWIFQPLSSRYLGKDFLRPRTPL